MRSPWNPQGLEVVLDPGFRPAKVCGAHKLSPEKPKAWPGQPCCNSRTFEVRLRPGLPRQFDISQSLLPGLLTRRFASSHANSKLGSYDAALTPSMVWPESSGLVFVTSFV